MTKRDQAFNDILPLLELRLFSYDFLRRTFLKEPTKDFFQDIKNYFAGSEFPLTQENELIAEGVAQVKRYVIQNDLLSESVYNSLHWDYTRMFIGPYELPSPPWESAYCNEERLLFQEETLEVRKAYLKYSLLPVELGHEADDHLGLELDFMFRLNELLLSESNNSSSQLIENLTDQKLFLKDHLLKWVPAFSEAVIQNADTEFYQGMAKILKGFLTLDLKALEELLDIIS